MHTDHDNDEIAAVAEPVEDATTQRDERGMATAEYAVGTVAAASFGAVLIKILTDEELQRLLLELILKFIGVIMNGVPNPF